jgi:LCP family protein required for cell wall assembly
MNKNKIFGIILAVLQSVFTLIFLGLIIVLNIMPAKYLIPLSILLTAFAGFTFFTQLSEKCSKIGKIFAIFIGSILILGVIYLFKIDRMFSVISSADVKIEAEKEMETKKETETEKQTEAVLKESNSKLTKYVFTVYISGIDTYGSISTTSRSDVNIIATVNTNTKQILLTSTPRDCYVLLPVEDGQMDKLTHAGIYGVDVSIGALENFYDISIDYYIRINFTTLIDMVDALGGITVDSEFAFNTKEYSFSKGENQLSGKEALDFARERYSFANGDKQRGENQMQVIKAMINKAMFPAVIKNAGYIIETISKNIETNMDISEITSLINMQLNDGAYWNIMMNSVKGRGDSRITYSGGKQKLYVMIPDQDSVYEAKAMMKQVMEMNKCRQSNHAFDIKKE